MFELFGIPAFVMAQVLGWGEADVEMQRVLVSIGESSLYDAFVILP